MFKKTLAVCFAAALLAGLLYMGRQGKTHSSEQAASSAAESLSRQMNKITDPVAKARVIDAMQKAPMSFEANEEQTDAQVKFVSRGTGYTLFLTGDGAVMALENSNYEPLTKQTESREDRRALIRPAQFLSGVQPSQQADIRAHREARSEAVLSMRIVGANPAAQISGEARLRNTSNYFIGNDHSKWRTGVPNYEKVRYSGVYRGVDLVYYGNQRQLEYDFVIAPGANPQEISLAFAGDVRGRKALPVRIEKNGDLIAQLEKGDVRFHKPVIYQSASITGQRTLIDGHYIIKNNGQIGFEVAPYDRTRELVIDPNVNYSTYLGGSNEDIGYGVALDSFGSCFIAGSTRSVDFPTVNPLEAFHGGTCGSAPCRDIFISKFNALGSFQEYSTFVGGSSDDVATDIMLDNLGDMTVVGYTLSTDFPLTKPIQPAFGGGTVTGDAFVFQIASRGTAFVYSTYLGGSSDDEAYSLGVDSNNNVYFAGYTASNNFPTTPGAYLQTCPLTKNNGCSTGFAAEVNSKGTTLQYSTFLGGPNGLGDAAYGIAVGAKGNAYITGITGSPNFPTTVGAYDRTCGTDGQCNGTYDGFVTALTPNGKALSFSTYLGGSGYDYTAGIVVDKAGSIYVSGNTTSADFPVTTNAVQSTFGGMSTGCNPLTSVCGDVTVTKLTARGASLIYSTYLGGSLDENPGISMAVDPVGNVYVTGQTDSTNFPVVNAFQSTYGGGSSDAFATRINTTGTAFVFSSYLGGSGPDFAYRDILDQFGDLFFTGGTVSTNFPVTGNSFQTTCGTDGSCNGGLSDAFATKIVASSDLAITNTAPTTVHSGQTLTYKIVSKNNGPDPAESVVVTDVTPTGTTFNSVTVNSGSCTTPPVGGTGTVSCTLANQPTGAGFNIKLTVNVTATSGSITDKASVDSNSADSNQSNNSATAVTTIN